jgi:hypothetical protein
MSVVSSESVSDLAYEQTIRVLDRQATVLSELRQRASIILSGTGIVVSLVGSDALTDGYSKPLAYAAFAATLLGLIACVVVLWPVSDKRNADGNRAWKVTLDLDDVDDLRAGKMGVDGLFTAFRAARINNYKTINTRSKCFTASCLLLTLQILLWSLLILENS